MRFAELDAVTVDGYGTLLELVDPAAALAEALARHEVQCGLDQVTAAFRAEASYYRARAHLGRDGTSLATLRRECAAVFLEALGDGVDLDASSFVDDFVGALRFDVVAGSMETLGRLRQRELPLAVVANWDYTLPEHLDRLRLDRFFSTVVTSAEAGAAKPDPAPFQLALARLGVKPSRALHVGDELADELGAEAAGMRFRPAPLATAFAGWS